MSCRPGRTSRSKEIGERSLLRGHKCPNPLSLVIKVNAYWSFSNLEVTQSFGFGMILVERCPCAQRKGESSMSTAPFCRVCRYFVLMNTSCNSLQTLGNSSPSRQERGVGRQRVMIRIVLLQVAFTRSAGEIPLLPAALCSYTGITAEGFPPAVSLS